MLCFCALLDVAQDTVEFVQAVVGQHQLALAGGAVPDFNARAKPLGEIFLQADKDVPYGFVVQAMAVVKAAGIDRMGLITESPD